MDSPIDQSFNFEEEVRTAWARVVEAVTKFLALYEKRPDPRPVGHAVSIVNYSHTDSSYKIDLETGAGRFDTLRETVTIQLEPKRPARITSKWTGQASQTSRRRNTAFSSLHRNGHLVFEREGKEYSPEEIAVDILENPLLGTSGHKV